MGARNYEKNVGMNALHGSYQQKSTDMNLLYTQLKELILNNLLLANLNK